MAADSSLAELGNMEIDGGTIDIVSENGDAISVYRTLYLNPTTLQVTTKNAAASTADGSYKGIKAGTTIYIPETAGTITADTTATYSSSRVQRDSNDPVADDSIHCDGYIRIDGGIGRYPARPVGPYRFQAAPIHNGLTGMTLKKPGRVRSTLASTS